jgi:hypothetical protein
VVTLLYQFAQDGYGTHIVTNVWVFVSYARTVEIDCYE